MVRDGTTFLCGIPRIQRTGTSLWWVPMTGSIYLKMERDGVTFLCGIPGKQMTGTSLWWVPVIVPHLSDDGEGWCDLPVWNPGNTEDGDISLVGSHDWIHLPDDGEGWCDLPVWNPGNTEDEDISLV
ncbi:unnamed protein product, partial [Staurois parvus]